MPERLETSRQQRLSASVEVCPNCGYSCQIVMQLADPAKATTKMSLTGPPKASMFVEEAFILCLWCLRRERRTYDSADSAIEHSTVLDAPTNSQISKSRNIDNGRAQTD